ncbi:MAG: SCO family protein [Acidobacteriota bacterium]|nr:SCO family protein [Acidobacteriota bacterium]
MRHFLLILCSVLFFSACQSSKIQETSPANIKKYDLKGRIISVNKTAKQAAIAHEEIPGFMSAMTMDFNIKDEEVLNELSPAAEVSGILYDDTVNADSWLEIKNIVAAPRSDQKPLPVKENAATIGKEIVDFTLTNQDGKQISPKDFRGKVWAMTFIYSECPLPNYCILMSKNFSDAANKIAADDNLKDKLRLLSISFDPKRDSPEKLKKYGLGYLGENSKAKDFKVWQIAVGEDERVRKIADFFGLYYKIDEKDETQFNHSLRTIVIDENGKIQKVFLGNEWKPEDLLREMKKNL